MIGMNSDQWETYYCTTCGVRISQGVDMKLTKDGKKLIKAQIPTQNWVVWQGIVAIWGPRQGTWVLLCERLCLDEI